MVTKESLEADLKNLQNQFQEARTVAANALDAAKRLEGAIQMTNALLGRLKTPDTVDPASDPQEG